MGYSVFFTDPHFLDYLAGTHHKRECRQWLAYAKKIVNQAGQLSNILCLPYKPTIFIPTAFTPNGDGLNDVFRPITFGIASYEMQIYNRWGQQVAELTQNDRGWDAAKAPIGAYMVTFRAKGTDNEWYTEKSTVTVVR